jgi:ribosome-binding factor A
MRRPEQLNEFLKNKLANLIAREIPMENGLITITYVDCAPDLRRAKIGFSVLPFNKAKNILEKLRKHSSVFTEILIKETRLRKIPKFSWVIDDTEQKASAMDKIFEEIERGK